MTVAARQRDLDEVHAGLVRWFRSHHPDAEDLVLSPLGKPSTGYSSETLLLDVTWREHGDDRDAHLVLRLPPAGGGIFPTYDLALQAAVQTALGPTSIPVARPIIVETNEEWVGSPFFVMERAPGWVLADSPSYVVAGKLVDAPAETQTRVQRDFINVLAELHTVDWDGLGLGFLTPEGERGLTHDLDRAETYVEWSTDGDVPAVIRNAFAWCRANKPDPEPPLSLIWGDPRLGNIVYDDDFAQVALLDWEMASIGPAELDLAWFVGLHDISAQGAGGDLPGFVDREGVLAAWSTRLGREVVDFEWFEVLSLVRAESIFLRIRHMLLAMGLDEPWLHGATPGQHRIAAIIASTV